MVRQSTRPALEAIQVELADPDYKVRKEAIKKLMRYQRKEAVEPLLTLLGDARADVRSKAVQALGRLADARALLPLLGLLGDKSVSVRTHVARTLGNFGDRSVVSPLQNLLNDPRPRLRQAAAMSLGRLRDPGSLPLLLAYLARVEYDEFYYLARAVGDFDLPGVIEPLLALCERDERAQAIIAEALSRLGASSTPVLERILVDQSRMPVIRACVALALGKKPRPGSTQSLIQALGDQDAKVRQYAAWSLGVLRDPIAIEPLIQVLSDEDENVCKAVIGALSILEATDAADALTSCLSSSHMQVVSAAARALEHLKATSAVPALLDAFCRLEYNYNYYVMNALCKLGSPAIVGELLQRLPAGPASHFWNFLYILEYFPDKCAVERLITLLDAHPESRYSSNLQIRIVRLLSKLGDARAIEPLSEMYAQASGSLQSAIGHALNALEVAQRRSA